MPSLSEKFRVPRIKRPKVAASPETSPTSKQQSGNSPKYQLTSSGSFLEPPSPKAPAEPKSPRHCTEPKSPRKAPKEERVKSPELGNDFVPKEALMTKTKTYGGSGFGSVNSLECLHDQELEFGKSNSDPNQVSQTETPAQASAPAPPLRSKQKSSTTLGLSAKAANAYSAVKGAAKSKQEQSWAQNAWNCPTANLNLLTGNVSTSNSSKVETQTQLSLSQAAAAACQEVQLNRGLSGNFAPQAPKETQLKRGSSRAETINSSQRSLKTSPSMNAPSINAPIVEDRAASYQASRASSKVSMMSMENSLLSSSSNLQQGLQRSWTADGAGLDRLAGSGVSSRESEGNERRQRSSERIDSRISNSCTERRTDKGSLHEAEMGIEMGKLPVESKFLVICLRDFESRLTRQLRQQTEPLFEMLQDIHRGFTSAKLANGDLHATKEVIERHTRKQKESKLKGSNSDRLKRSSSANSATSANWDQPGDSLQEPAVLREPRTQSMPCGFNDPQSVASSPSHGVSPTSTASRLPSSKSLDNHRSGNKDLRTVFDELVVNKDGSISEEKLQASLEAFGFKEPAAAAKSFIQVVGTNKGCSLSFDDFQKFMESIGAGFSTDNDSSAASDLAAPSPQKKSLLTVPFSAPLETVTSGDGLTSPPDDEEIIDVRPPRPPSPELLSCDNNSEACKESRENSCEEISEKPDTVDGFALSSENNQPKRSESRQASCQSLPSDGVGKIRSRTSSLGETSCVSPIQEESTHSPGDGTHASNGVPKIRGQAGESDTGDNRTSAIAMLREQMAGLNAAGQGRPSFLSVPPEFLEVKPQSRLSSRRSSNASQSLGGMGDHDEVNQAELSNFFKSVMRRVSQADDMYGEEQDQSLRQTLYGLNQEMRDLEDGGAFGHRTSSGVPEGTSSGALSFLQQKVTVEEFWPLIMRVLLRVVGVVGFTNEDSDWSDNMLIALGAASTIWTLMVQLICFSFAISEFAMLIVTHTRDRDRDWAAGIPRMIKFVLAVSAMLMQRWLRSFFFKQFSLLHLMHMILVSFGGMDVWQRFTRNFVYTVLCTCIAVVVAMLLLSNAVENDLDDEIEALYGGYRVLRTIHLGLLALPATAALTFFSALCSMCMGLQLGVDAFGMRIILEGTAMEGKQMQTKDVVAGWRTLNALVQAMSYATQWAVGMTLGGCSLMIATVFYHYMSVENHKDLLMTLLMVVCPAAVIVILLVRTSGITQRCSRVATVANSLPSLKDSDKMSLVHFLRNSDSGYRLFNEPVSRWFAAKVTYVLFMLIIFVLRSITDE